MRAVIFSSNSITSASFALNSGTLFKASLALEPACKPSVFPAKSARLAYLEFARTTKTCRLSIYGSLKRRALWRSGVIVRPFQMQSMLPVLSSCSLASQLMGWSFRVMPRREQTSLATSMSKPTIWPFSSRKRHFRMIFPVLVILFTLFHPGIILHFIYIRINTKKYVTKGET